MNLGARLEPDCRGGREKLSEKEDDCRHNVLLDSDGRESVNPQSPRVVYNFCMKSFWIFSALTAGALAFGVSQDRPLLDLAILAAGGLLAWTLVEYLLHRLVFHREIRNARLREILSGQHIAHHNEPRDPAHIFVRTPNAIATSLLIAGALLLFSRSLFSTAGILSGLWMGFLYYEWVHYRVHRTASEGMLISRQRRRHFDHHFRDAERSFGVTTPLWDYVFGTRGPTSR